MDLIKFEAFFRAATEKNITRAAEDLGYSQSGVSHMIRDLEAEFGVPLLYRGKAGVKLTREGEMLFPFAARILEEKRRMEETAASLRGLETGTVRVGAFTSVSVQCLPRLMKEMRQAYPGIQLEPAQGDYNEIAAWLDEGKIDCGFLTDYSCPERFSFLPLFEDRIMAVLAPDHPLQEESSVPLSLVTEEDFIFPGPGFDGDVRHLLEQAGVRPRIRYTIYGDDAIVALAASGLGMAILPELYLLPYRDRILALPLDPPARRQIGLALRRGSTPSPAVQAFIRVARDVLKHAPL